MWCLYESNIQAANLEIWLQKLLTTVWMHHQFLWVSLVEDTQVTPFLRTSEGQTLHVFADLGKRASPISCITFCSNSTGQKGFGHLIDTVWILQVLSGWSHYDVNVKTGLFLCHFQGGKCVNVFIYKDDRTKDVPSRPFEPYVGWQQWEGGSGVFESSWHP